MHTKAVANFMASDLKKSGPILDAAMRGVVRISRRKEVYVLLRESQFEEIIEDAADPRPKCLADLLVGYDADDVKKRLGGWLNDAPAGGEAL